MRVASQEERELDWGGLELPSRVCVSEAGGLA